MPQFCVMQLNITNSQNTTLKNIFYFDVLLTVHLSIFISVINQLDAQNFCFTVSLFHASTCFEHMCSSSGGQNCIIQYLVSLHSVGGRPVHRLREALSLNLRTGRPLSDCDDTRGCITQFWPPDDEHICSKHVEAWNKCLHEGPSRSA